MESSDEERESFVATICRHYFTLLREKLMSEAYRRCKPDQREELNVGTTRNREEVG
jgi:hypothetical protein